MSISELVKQFEAAKLLVEPVIREKRMVLPIYRVVESDEHFKGDGFFYSSPNKLDWKMGGTGFDISATPENLLDSYLEFYNPNTTMEFALSDATARLNEWYNKLISGEYGLPREK